MPLDDVTAAPLPRLPARPADSHKGDFGRALLVGGSRGMSGAIALAGLATLRSGAGLDTLAVPQSIQDVVASFSPCYMTNGLAEDQEAGLDVRSLGLANRTAIGIGPGLGRSKPIMASVLSLYSISHIPMVVDADALFALAEVSRPRRISNGPRILTPHPGEFERLTRRPYVKARRIEDAAELARSDTGLHSPMGDISGVMEGAATRPETIVVLKGHETVVTDGQRYSINHTGNPGMATGGTGDVLTGVITGLLCQGLSPFDAARLGVHVHGLAGDLAAAELGQVAMIASDLIDYLPEAFRGLE